MSYHKWNARRANGLRSAWVRRYLRRSDRIAAMSRMDWEAYSRRYDHKPLLHKGGKP